MDNSPPISEKISFPVLSSNSLIPRLIPNCMKKCGGKAWGWGYACSLLLPSHFALLTFLLSSLPSHPTTTNLHPPPSPLPPKTILHPAWKIPPPPPPPNQAYNHTYLPSPPQDNHVLTSFQPGTSQSSCQWRGTMSVGFHLKMTTPQQSLHSVSH